MTLAMAWWPFSRRDQLPGEPPDYYREGLRLASQQKYHEALTSFRLALRTRPGDTEIMEQMAVIYTHIGMPDEAVRYYEEAIDAGAASPAAHYGLAFLLLRRGDVENGRRHLEAFLSRPPTEAGAVAHIEHARQTLERLEASDATRGDPGIDPGGSLGDRLDF
jgi:Flp pilus assembly protein TadD